jgi:hypothetical protein
LSKDITFHINNEAYSINLGEDRDDQLELSIKKFLSVEDPLTTKDLLLAYLRRTQEFVNFQNEVEKQIHMLPTLENLEELKNSKS